MSGSQGDQTQRSGFPPSDSASNVSFSVAQQVEFTRKEIRETLRDRRTIVTLMVMPLLLYPLLGFALRFVAFQQSSDSTIEYRLAIETEHEARWLSEALQFGDRLLETSEDPPDIQVLVPNDASQLSLESMVAESSADLGIRVKLGQSAPNGQSASVQLYENEASSQSREAARYVERRLAAANIELLKTWAKQHGQTLPVPVRQARNVVKPEETRSAILGLLPVVLLLMTVTGGVYPAIDLTAGERERNTMETLMALPVPRFRLLVAKYVAVVSVTILTGLMNLLATSVTLYALQLDRALLGEDGFTIVLAAKLFLTIVVFALFYSAVLLLLTSSARSFKEAQAYLIPLFLLSIAPGLVILMPGWNLAGGTSAIPLLNILLLARELLEGTVQRFPAMIAIISTVFYGVSALSLAAQVFGTDAVAVGSRGRWRDFLQRPKVPSPLPSLSLTLSTLALLFSAYFIASGILARGETQPTVRLALSAVMTVVLFVVIPLALLHWKRVSRTQGLGLTWAAWPCLIAALLLGLATWPWIFELIVFVQGLGIRGFDPDRIADVDALLAGWKQVPLWIIVLCLGVVPGICEEVFFRGFLFNGLKQHLNAVGTIALSAIAFGLFHVILSGGAAPERILPSTLMGILLGWMAWQSNSTIPSMILHAVHNSTLLIVVQSRDLLAQWNTGQIEQHLPISWLAVSAVVLISSAPLVYLPTRQRHSRPTETNAP